MTWSYQLTAQSRRDMRRMSVADRQRVFQALDRYVADRRGDVVKLRGYDNEWRLRVGDIRIRFLVDHLARQIVVLRVLHRGAAYRD